MHHVTNLRDVPLEDRPHARGGLFHNYSLLHGEEGTPENFYLQLASTYGDFDSPRHRHNFDQVRLQLEGEVDFGRNGVMAPGTVGYFPEGVYYGPQSVPNGKSKVLVLQYGGASGSGYVAEARLQQGMAELRKTGTFEKGVYKTHDRNAARRNQDGYEAVWEHVNGRPLHYPEDRYLTPLFMRPSAFQWRSTDTAGVERKHLGTFAEGSTQIAMLRLASDASYEVRDRTLLFVLGGEGRAGEHAWETHSAMYSGASASLITAHSPCELLEVQLHRH
ncbi:MAG: hypothetical protein JWQ03_2808 [Variovorax sp.]|nr:hypothetical protein [Variovorax sp.]